MVRHYCGLSTDVAAVRMTGVDHLGADLRVERAGGDAFAARLPFPAPAEDRGALKAALVEMTRAARAAA